MDPRAPAFRQGPDFRHIRMPPPPRHKTRMTCIAWPSERGAAARYPRRPGAAVAAAHLPRGMEAT